MRCKLIHFIDKHGVKVSPRMNPSFVTMFALIQRLEKHPKLGDPKPGKLTVTSKIRHISVDGGYFITQNSTYDFAGA